MLIKACTGAANEIRLDDPKSDPITALQLALAASSGVPLEEAAAAVGAALGKICRNSKSSGIRQNNAVGNSFDDYVAGTKLKGLDDRGQLGRQERLPTPDIDGRNYVKPDYSLRLLPAKP